MMSMAASKAMGNTLDVSLTDGKSDDVSDRLMLEALEQ